MTIAILGRARARDRSRPSQQPFSPLQIPGLQTWYDANPAFVTKGGDDRVTSWTDRSGNGRHATQGDSAKQPLWEAAQINGQPSLHFDGGDVLSTSAFGISTFSLFIVNKLTGAVGYLVNVGASTDTYLWGSITCSGFVALISRGGSGNSAKNRTTNWAVDNIAKQVCWEHGGTHATHSLRVNRAAPGFTDCAPHTADPGSNSVSLPLNIGATSTGATGSTGKIAELLLYSPVLSAANRTRIEDYLFARYAT